MIAFIFHIGIELIAVCAVCTSSHWCLHTFFSIQQQIVAKPMFSQNNILVKTISPICHYPLKLYSSHQHGYNPF